MRSLLTNSYSRRWWMLGITALLVGCSARDTGKRQHGQTQTTSVATLQLEDGLREAMLARAMLVVNTPYTYGGNTPDGGFDCSGLIQWTVQGIHNGKLPRTTAQWAVASSPVHARNLRRGDFVFFNTMGSRYSHMGIFVGNGQFVHAPSKGGTVQRVRMDNPYFSKRFTGARSIFK